ncbi:MAG TPA: AsmA-like C-terminal domain-containing protein [Candidatus Binatia bacterium]|nr:AsmA-like C-terminal domain-containing protein [Candidatus Binatia bacterium]
MTKALKLCGFLVFTVFLFLVAVSLAFYHLVQVGELRRFLIGQIERQTDLKVQLGAAQLEIGKILGVSFHDLALTEPERSQPEIMAERITARVALWPLLQRQLIFYEVRLQKPSARLVRDEEGRIPLLEKLLDLSFLKQEETGLAFDLRSVKIAGGEFYFHDGAPDAEATTRWRDIAVDLEVVRGERLRDFFRERRPQPFEGRGVAIEFNLQTTLERSAQRGILRAKGRMMFPPGSLDYRSAWWSANLESTDFPPELLLAFAGSKLPIESMTGFLAPRVQIEGSSAGRFRVKGEVAFMRLAVDAPAVFSAALVPGNGRAEFDLDWAKPRLAIRRIELRSNEIKFLLHGEVRALDADDPHWQLTFSTPSLPISVFGKYLPSRLIDSLQFKNGVAALENGEVELHELAVNGTVSELRRSRQLGESDPIRFDASLRRVSARLSGDGTLAVRNGQGRVRFERGGFYFKELKGNYGQSALTDGAGNYQLLSSGRARYDFRLAGEIDLAQVKDQMKLDVFPVRLARLAAPLHDVGGRGSLDLGLHKDADAPLQIEGKLSFDDARMRWNDLQLTELKGEVVFSPKEIRAEKIRAVFGGSPVGGRLSLKDYDSENGSFDLAVESSGMKSAALTRLLLSSGSPQDPGWVRGSIRYQGPLASAEGRKFTGVLDLVNVQLATPPLLQPLRELTGRVIIDDRGVDFQGLKGLLVGSPARLSGRWRFAERPNLLFDFSAPHLDITYLLSQLDTESSDFYANLQAAGKVALGKGRLESVELTDLTTDVAVDRRVWRLSKVAARSETGTIAGVATIVDKPDSLAFSIEPTIQDVPVQRVLDWFEAGKADMTGYVNLSGKFESAGKNRAERKKNLNGSFKLKIEDGTLGRLRIMVQILNLLDLSRWFTLQMPDLSKEGVGFRSITGDFNITQGVYSTQNLFVDSDDLRMTGEGRIDVPRDEIDFIVAVRPFAGIDTVIHYIPLIGRGIAAIKNSFLVASFNIRGPIDNPTITPAPLSTLSEVLLGVLGIPKNIIGFGEPEAKNEPQKDQTKERVNEQAPGAGP